MVLKRRDDTPKPISVPTSGDFDGNDGEWSTFIINVGGNEFRVLVSTAGSITWVPMDQGCTPSDPGNCPELRGVENTKAGARSPGYNPSTQNLLGEFGLQLSTVQLSATYGSEYNVNGSFYKDTVGSGHLNDPDSWQFPESPVAGLTDKTFLLGSFGLDIRESHISVGYYKSYLWNLHNNTKIPSKSYGYTAGASYRQPQLSGSLVLGGYDQSRFTPSQYSYSMDNGISLYVQSIDIKDNTNHQSATLDEQNYSHAFQAVIDSTLPYLWLPRPVCDRFEKIFSLSYNESSGLYGISDDARQNNIQNNPIVVMKLAKDQNSQNVTTISLSYAAFDLTASWPIYPNSTYYFPIRRAPGDTYVLGRSFLQETYLTVDYERNNFSIAQANLNTTPQKLVPILMPSQETEKKGMSKGAIAGIALGIVFAVLFLAGLAFYFWRRHQKQKKQRLADEDAARQQSTTETSTVVDGRTGSVLSSPTSELPDESRRISEMAVAGHEYFTPHHRKLGSGESHELDSPNTAGTSPGGTDKIEAQQWMQRHGRQPSELSTDSEIHELQANEAVERPLSPAQQGQQQYMAGEIMRPHADRRVSGGTQGSRRSTMGASPGLETHEEHADEHAGA